MHRPDPEQLLGELTEQERLVLGEMASDIGYRAKTLASYTRLPVKAVRAAQRRLKSLGLAYYCPLYDYEEYRVAGSGYLLSSEGRKAQNALFRSSLPILRPQ